LKRHALLAEQGPQALIADVVDHPLGDHELGQLRQRPGRERKIVISRPRQRHLLDLLSLRQRELRWPPACVLGVKRGEAVVVEVVDHLPHPILGGERDLGDRRDIHPLR
jgi:hypothetical protein